MHGILIGVTYMVDGVVAVRVIVVSAGVQVGIAVMWRGGPRSARRVGGGGGPHGGMVRGQEVRPIPSIPPIPAGSVVRGVGPLVMGPVASVTSVSFREMGAGKGAPVPSGALVGPVPPRWVVPPGWLVRLIRPVGHLYSGVTFVRHCEAVNSKFKKKTDVTFRCFVSFRAFF